MIEQRDYVALGTDRLPDGSRKPNTLAYLSVYLQSCTDLETAVLQILNAIMQWNRVAPQFSFVLEIIGKLIGQPRPDGFSDEDYRNVLIARTIVRTSDSSKASLVRLVAFLSTLNGGIGRYTVSGGPPEHWKITLFEVVLTAQWQAVYARLIIDAIGVTDSFTLTTATTANALYDDDNTLYDVSLYNP